MFLLWFPTMQINKMFNHFKNACISGIFCCFCYQMWIRSKYMKNFHWSKVRMKKEIRPPVTTRGSKSLEHLIKNRTLKAWQKGRRVKTSFCIAYVIYIDINYSILYLWQQPVQEICRLNILCYLRNIPMTWHNGWMLVACTMSTHRGKMNICVIN